MVHNISNPFSVDPNELRGKRALVTGGTRGIGAAIVRRLVAAGASVVGSARTAVPDFPDGAVFVKGDVGTLEGARALAAEVTKQLGGIDLLINNAGAANAYAGSLAVPDEEWLSALYSNYLPAVRLTAALLPAMIERKSGVVVNVSTAAAFIPVPQLIHYGAAKAALNAYSKSLATEVAPHGIRVNVLSPGNVVSPGADKIRDDLAKSFGTQVANLTAGIPLGRIGVPTDISELVGFLVSERAAWITGSTFHVDGGDSPFVG